MIHLVKHDSDFAGDFSGWQVAVELDFDVATLAVWSHNSAPDNSASAFFAVDDFGVFSGFVNKSNSFSEVPLATGGIVDTFKFDDGLVHGLSFQTSAVAGKDASDVKSAF